jgi:hypothetical protein
MERSDIRSVGRPTPEELSFVGRYEQMVVGRGREVAERNVLLDRARGGLSSFVILNGQAGIRRLALLNATAAGAQVSFVIRLEGTESEMQLAGGVGPSKGPRPEPEKAPSKPATWLHVLGSRSTGPRPVLNGVQLW